MAVNSASEWTEPTWDPPAKRDEWRVHAVTLSPSFGRRVSAFLPLNAGILRGVYPERVGASGAR